MENEKCPHGLEVSDNGEGYCASCVYDALYDGRLGLSMGIHPDLKRKNRNKAKRERKLK